MSDGAIDVLLREDDSQGVVGPDRLRSLSTQLSGAQLGIEPQEEPRSAWRPRGARRRGARPDAALTRVRAG